ncbi:hypothetical protein M7I_7919 [Glarea lozoyensis 74030]|uniref:Uncharacterized protein n=1 Tax=Glarea lozoyensis (strain ATCC 74030 / MF5533) TaxID=1104152 RepID=H0EYL3_GLAL7|nr:hypothetical protein M7I_7919 [Glarea lozoyensis 74030]
MATSTPTSHPLSEKTSHLEAQTPVAPAEAKAAQIPLKEFTIPTFPPEAFTAGLTTLILTSDIKMNDQLFAGTTAASKTDALAFLQGLKALKEIHFLDVFTPPGVLAEIGAALSSETVFTEISYTYRHSDPEFAKGLAVGDMSAFVRDGGKALRLAMQAPDVSAADEEDREGTEVGIFPVQNAGAMGGVVDRLVECGGGLVLLDVTVLEVGVKDVLVLLEACPKLKVLALSVSLEKGWEEVMNEVKGRLGAVESLELVGVPSSEAVETLKSQDEFLSAGVLGELGGEVKAVTVSVLRTRSESWSLESGKWTKV